MQTKELLQLVVHELFKQLAANTTLYAEIRFAPLQQVDKGLSAYEVVAATEAATTAAIKEPGLKQG